MLFQFFLKARESEYEMNMLHNHRMHRIGHKAGLPVMGMFARGEYYGRRASRF